MHPRRPRDNAAARPRVPQLRSPEYRLLEHQLPGRGLPGRGLPGHGLLRGRSARRWSVAGQIALLAAAAALVAGCAHSAAPAAAKAVPHPAPSCGSVKTHANVPVQIEVAKGKVACADAMSIERSYTAAIAQGRAPGNGAGPVEVSGWTCQAYTTPQSLKTGDLSACHRSGAEILAVLPPP